MTSIFLAGALLLGVGLGWRCRQLGMVRKREIQSPAYVWLGEEEPERNGAPIALCLFVLRDDVGCPSRYRAQWHSGLGSDFPACGLN